MSNGVQSKIDEQALSWFVRLRDESVGDAERAAFAEWRLQDRSHAHAFDELTNLWSNLGETDSSRQDAPVAVAAVVGHRTYPARAWFAASFAAVVLTFGTYQAFAPPGGVRALLADARTAPGEMRDLTLPDGTRVRLAGASALSYEISAQDRRVTMIAGRAFFDVRHEVGRPFSVRAGSAEVRDIGTAFEIATAKDRSSVAVAQGQVEIALGGGQAKAIQAGQSVAFDKSLGPVMAIAPGEIAAWRSNRLVFDNALLSDVLDELQSLGAGRIFLLDSSLGKKRLTGAFDTRRPGQALDAVAAITGARVTWIGPIALVAARGSDKSVAKP